MQTIFSNEPGIERSGHPGRDEQNRQIRQLWANYEKPLHKRIRCYVRRLLAGRSDMVAG